MAARSQSTDIWPPRSRTPGRGRREASVERSLAKVREAHQKALTTVVTLEEEIQQLSCPLVRSWPEVWAHSKSKDHHVHRSRGWKRRHCQGWPENCPAPYFKYHPSRRNLESGREVAATGDPDLEEPPELGLEVTCFLRGSAKNSPEPPVKELCKSVTWKAEACKTPSWWWELMAVPEVEDFEKLAQEVWASFWLPKRASKLHKKKNYHQAPPALLCLLRKNFLPPPDSIFACQDIWEMQWEKMVAYAPALQYWVEKTDPPAGGRPCLLVESVKELQEEMRCYLSFSDKEVLKGMIPPEETSAIPTEEADPQSTTIPAGSPGEEAIAGAAREPAVERRSPSVPWLGEGITPVSTHGGCQTDPPSIKRSKTEVLQLGRKGGLNPLNWIIKDDDHPTGSPLTYTRVRSYPMSDTNSQFSGGDSMSKERSTTKRGLHSIP